jgi:hypothetical protein
MVLVETGNYVFLGVLGFIAMVWVLSSMGIVKSRNHELYVAKQRHIRQAVTNIDKAYDYMESLPPHARAKIVEHLDNGMTNHAVETARAHHDVFHFFKNFN